jgi:hypothetical protein
MVFLALCGLFPELWLLLRFPGGFVFKAIVDGSFLIRDILFIAFLFVSCVLVTFGVDLEI